MSAEIAVGTAAESSAEVVAVERAPILKIRDLVSRVVEVSGVKRKDVKDIVEATLGVLGDALARGEDMNLPGLGRTRVARSSEKDGAAHLTLKVRRGPHRPKVSKEPLADEEDDS
ncbi:MAG: HU family DNA-binding protein [Paracoccaceae bacterium]